MKEASLDPAWDWGLDVHMVSAIRTLYRGGLIDDQSAQCVVDVCASGSERGLAAQREAWKRRNNAYSQPTD